MFSIEQITNITSLLISLVSLIISVIALILSKKVYYLSSKDYFPEINFSFEDDWFEILNKSVDIFEMSSINVFKVETFGFEDFETKRINEILFVTKSKIFRWFEKKGKKTRFSFDAPGPCAYLCPYDAELIKQVSDKISEKYSLDSKKGYALPSIRSVCYVVEILYKNRFLEHKSVIFKYQHFHGHGFEKFKITKDEMGEILERANIPGFETFADLWSFLMNGFKSTRMSK